MPADLIVTLVFLIPGFIALEVANSVSPRTNLKHGDTQRLFSTAIMGGFIFWLYALTGYGGNMQTAFNCAKLERITWWGTLLVGLLAMAVGFLWGWFRVWFPGAYYRLSERGFARWHLPSYHGMRTVRDAAMIAMKGKHVRVNLSDKRIISGTIESAGTIEGDGDLLVKVMYDARHEDDDPRVELDVVQFADGEEPLIFIPASSIVSFETTESEGSFR